ncbi:hypothetical protein EMQ25_03530 [Arsenicitalea aurantiaca]|uniref:Rap1a immunity protein domain-containing protein n=1 Tax=Arsenicitalea aurantiaca TaxID=1783274 RepID=A0A433XLS1_9HYPH|nr:Rap1a/Tai family immunity protein [Arsenicitalea aurantiaca]RUT35036.1 hypothetical protein EMQ25_03530 [Arsenicitalea aurantiaca]
MKTILAPLALAGLLALPQPASAASSLWTGAVLAEACADGELYYLFGQCMGFLAGVHDQYRANFGETALICLPEDSTPEALREPLLTYLDANPGEVELPAHALTVRALIAAFPCG